MTSPTITRAAASLILLAAALTGGCSSGGAANAKDRGMNDGSPTTLASAPRVYFKTWSDAAGEHKYALYLPPENIAKGPYPLVVFLHGYGECGKDGVKPTAVGLLPAVVKNPDRWPCAVLIPQKPEFDPLWPTQYDVVMAEIEQVKQFVSIDTSRIALTGLSQGGNGTWMFAAKYPDVWSAIAPVCGFHREVPAADIAAKVKDLPIWAFHGLKDNVVPPAQTREVIDAVKAASPTRDVKLTEFPEANHNSWDDAYGDPEFARWLLAQKKP